MITEPGSIQTFGKNIGDPIQTVQYINAYGLGSNLYYLVCSWTALVRIAVMFDHTDRSNRLDTCGING